MRPNVIAATLMRPNVITGTLMRYYLTADELMWPLKMKSLSTLLQD